MLGVVGDDAARLLPAMLQSVQAKRDEVCRIGNPDHTKDATFFAKLVVVRRIERVTGEGLHLGRISGLRPWA